MHPWFAASSDTIEMGLKLNAERGGTEISRLVERVKSGLMSQAQRQIGLLIKGGTANSYFPFSMGSDLQDLHGLTDRSKLGGIVE